MKSKNPFILTFGKKPENFISRYESKNTVIDTFCDTDLSQTYQTVMAIIPYRCRDFMR